MTRTFIQTQEFSGNGEDQGSGIRDQGSGIRDQGFGIWDLRSADDDLRRLELQIMSDPQIGAVMRESES